MREPVKIGNGKNIKAITGRVTMLSRLAMPIRRRLTMIGRFAVVSKRLAKILAMLRRL